MFDPNSANITKPKTLACYICGRQFGTKSLSIHIKSCQQKFKIQQQKKQYKLRIKLPQEPKLLQQILNGNHDPETIEQHNRQALDIHKHKIMPSCKNCGRTFNEESLIVHLKSCKSKDGSTGYESGSQGYSIPQDFKKPRTLVCCVCGRQFGLTSLKIHYYKCTQKFKNQQKLKPKKQRTPVPRFNEQQEQMINNKEEWTLQEIQAFNSSSTSHYRDKALVQCSNCKRKFFAEAYQKHKKNCKMINGDKGGGGGQSGYSQYGAAQTGCVCGRQFGLTSLKIHYYKCIKKFKNQQMLKPKAQRIPVPKFSEQQEQMIKNKEEWTLQEIQAFNSNSTSHYRDKALVQCSNCKRKFFPEAYQKHKKNCKMINGDKGGGSQSGYSQYGAAQTGQIKKPKVLMCHICGRQFGLSSLGIHHKTCVKKFIEAEDKKPKKQRRPLPELNFDDEQQFNLQNALDWDVEKIARYNSMADDVYKGCSLFKCHICGRKFFQDALKRHLNYCQKNQQRQEAKKQQQSTGSDQLPTKSEIMKRYTKTPLKQKAVPEKSQETEIDEIQKDQSKISNNALQTKNKSLKQNPKPKQIETCELDETKQKLKSKQKLKEKNKEKQESNRQNEQEEKQQSEQEQEQIQAQSCQNQSQEASDEQEHEQNQDHSDHSLAQEEEDQEQQQVQGQLQQQQQVQDQQQEQGQQQSQKGQKEEEQSQSQDQAQSQSQEQVQEQSEQEQTQNKEQEKQQLSQAMAKNSKSAKKLKKIAQKLSKSDIKSPEKTKKQKKLSETNGDDQDQKIIQLEDDNLSESTIVSKPKAYKEENNTGLMETVKQDELQYLEETIKSQAPHSKADSPQRNDQKTQYQQIQNMKSAEQTDEDQPKLSSQISKPSGGQESQPENTAIQTKSSSSFIQTNKVIQQQNSQNATQLNQEDNTKEESQQKHQQNGDGGSRNEFMASSKGDVISSTRNKISTTPSSKNIKSSTNQIKKSEELIESSSTSPSQVKKLEQITFAPTPLNSSPFVPSQTDKKFVQTPEEQKQQKKIQSRNQSIAEKQLQPQPQLKIQPKQQPQPQPQPQPQHKQLNLIKCTKCERSFKQDRIGKHESVCKNKKKSIQPSQQQLNNKGAADKSNIIAKPKLKIPKAKIAPNSKEKELPQQQKQQTATANIRKTQNSSIKGRTSIMKPQQFKSQEVNGGNLGNDLSSTDDLAACEKCGRKFIPERLQKHLSVCRQVKRPSKRKLVKKAQQVGDSTQQQSNTCSQSKRKVQQSTNPISTKKFPASKQHTSENSNKQIIQSQRSNIDQTDVENTELKACRKCNRNFAAQRVQKHESVCKASTKSIEHQSSKEITKIKSKSKKNQQSKQNISTNSNVNVNELSTKKQNSIPTPTKTNKDLLPQQQKQVQNISIKACCKCNRKFALDRLQKHESICKAQINQISTTAPLAQKPKPVKTTFNIKQSSPFKPNKAASKNQKIKENIQSTNKILQQLQNDDIFQIDSRKKIQYRKNQTQNGFYQPKLQHLPPKVQVSIQSKEQKNEDFSQFMNQDLISCQKCDRKFKVDRIQKHQNICKGAAPRRNSKLTQNHALNTQKILSRTPNKAPFQQKGSQINNTAKVFQKSSLKKFPSQNKNNYLAIVKQIKNMRKKQQDIDQELQNQISSRFKKQQPIPKTTTVTRKTTNNFYTRTNKSVLKPNEMHNSGNLDVEVGKWKKPMQSLKKQPIRKLPKISGGN